MGRHGKQNAMNFDTGPLQLGSMDNLDKVAAMNRHVFHPGISRRNTSRAQSLDNPDWPFY